MTSWQTHSTYSEVREEGVTKGELHSKTVSASVHDRSPWSSLLAANLAASSLAAVAILCHITSLICSCEPAGYIHLYGSDAPMKLVSHVYRELYISLE